MIIAIDFDGIIAETKNLEIISLIPDAKEIINQLAKDGHRIIIWTCRYIIEHLVEMNRFLIANRIMFHAVNINDPREQPLLGFWPDKKIYADVYIDDHNLGGFPGWKTAYEIINKMEVKDVRKAFC